MKEKTTKHKITLEIQAKIQAVNKRLPPMGKFSAGKPVYTTAEVSGAQLRNEDVKPGTPINPDMMYRVRRLVYENHAMNMINLVQREGVEAISRYEAAVMAQYNAFKREDAKARTFKHKFLTFINKLWQKMKAPR